MQKPFRRAARERTGDACPALDVGRDRGTRLIRGAGAQVVSQVTIFTSQIASVALFIRFWGPDLYGEWLTLFAIPSYLAISDLGFTTATAHEMAIQLAKGNLEAAYRAFATTRRVVMVVAVLVPVTITALAAVIPLTSIFRFAILDRADVMLIVFGLGAQVGLGLYCQLYYALFYSVGRYAEGVLLLSLALGLELGCVGTVVAAGAGPRYAAFALAAGRGLAAIVMRLRWGATTGWAPYTKARGSRAVAQSLLRPALASGAFPLGNLANLQGITLVVGAVLGPLAVVAFSTLRTMTRAGLQALRAVFAIVQPEVSRAFGKGDVRLLRRLHLRALQTALALALPLTLMLLVFGQNVFDLWTGGRIELDREVLGLLLAVVVVNSLWYTSLSITYATNRHAGVALVYMTTTSVTLVAAYYLARAVGITGVAGALVVSELVMAAYVLPVTLRLLDQPPRDFFREFFHIRSPGASSGRSH